MRFTSTIRTYRTIASAAVSQPFREKRKPDRNCNGKFRVDVRATVRKIQYSTVVQ